MTAKTTATRNIEELNKLYITNRKKWRKWLQENFQTENEVWLVYPNKATGKSRILYNDAVEEALCFGWIDSLMYKIDPDHAMQKFTPRNPKSGYSQLNKERLKWLAENGLIHPDVMESVKDIVQEEFVFPKDIMQAIERDAETWRNFQNFSDSYKRIRIAYIDGARKRPEEFEKRLTYFLNKTKQNKRVRAFGGSEKYY